MKGHTTTRYIYAKITFQLIYIFKRAWHSAEVAVYRDLYGGWDEKAVKHSSAPACMEVGSARAQPPMKLEYTIKYI